MTVNQLSRRGFLELGTATGAAVLTRLQWVHAAGSDILRIGLVGCGGRGSGSLLDSLDVKGAPMKLVAMADVFKNRLDSSYGLIKKQFGDRVDVPQDRQFVGFDGYRKAMDCLKPGDIVILATPPAFRWVHFTYAVQKGLHTFMEKPVTVDGPTSRKMFKLGEEAAAKNLKVGVGLMSRHQRGAAGAGQACR